MIGTQAAYRSHGPRLVGVVGKRSECCEVEGATDHGALGSENADISNDKAGQNPARLNPKVSWGRLVRPGLVGS
jgi:hypothetical protein